MAFQWWIHVRSVLVDRGMFKWLRSYACLYRINCTNSGAYTVMRICYFRDLDRCWVYLYATCNSHTQKICLSWSNRVGPTSSTTSTALYETHPAARVGLRHGNCAHLKWQNTMSVWYPLIGNNLLDAWKKKPLALYLFEAVRCLWQ